MKKQLLSPGLRFCLMEWTYYGRGATLRAFVVSYALSLGYTQAWTSRMIGFGALAAVIGLVFWSALSDRWHTNKKTYLSCVMIILAVNLGIFFAPNQTVFFWMFMLLCFADGAGGAILDTWILRSLASNVGAYSKIRAFGGLGYAMMMLLMGALIEKIGYSIMPVMATLITIVNFIAALGMEDVHIQAEASGRAKGSLRERMGFLLIPQYLLLLSVLLALGFACSPVSNLKIALLEHVGGNVATQGVDGFVGDMLQFGTYMYVIGWLQRKVNARAQLLLSALVMLTSMILQYVAKAPWQVVAASSLMAVDFALVMTAARRLVVEIVPIEKQTVANSLADACYSSVSCMISMMYAGTISQNYGVKTMVFVSGMFAAAGVGLMLLSLLREHSCSEK